MTEDKRAVGKCENDHAGSYGYPTRPEEPYDFCSQCGKEMVWHCPDCNDPLPQDVEELVLARFCRNCGTQYFSNGKTKKKS
ncbi:MAG TPA: DUF2321 domain-containing protein [Dehalococcoidia bacterium]|nr:DUF2321 domain-containing protein [Dehalococcoidia bacterium]